MAPTEHISGFLPGIARAVVLAVIPLSLIWVPLAKLPGFGNVAAGDAALITLWLLTAAGVLLRGPSRVELRPVLMAVLAVAIATLAALGSETGPSRGRGAVEFMAFMKRFGLASILPLALTVFRSPRMGQRLRALSAVLVGALVTFTFTPSFRALLPSAQLMSNPEAIGDRATGLVTNANDLAYVSVGLAALHTAFLPARATLLARALLAAVLAGAATCIISSGSRSGVIGAGAALVFLLSSSAIAARTRFALAAAVAVFGIVGLTHSSVFQDRIGRAYQQGLQEENVSSRLYYQRLAVTTALAYPLGVGYTGFREATTRRGAPLALDGSDSVYCDTLLGAGVLGLVGLLTLFGVAWRHVSTLDPKDIGSTVRVLQAGLLAYLVFGIASISPISVFSAPLFFCLVAGPSCVGTRSVRERRPWAGLA